MKVLFVWSGLTGYMGDCWRELSGRPGVELKVAVDTREQFFGGGFRAEEVMHDLDWSTQLPGTWQPEVIFTVGWHNSLCRAAALKSEWRNVPKVCCFDMPWRCQVRCLAAKFVLYPYLRHFAAACVPGRAAHRYARWLGFRRIYDGLFATNTRRFTEHKGGGGLVYVGREVPDKGVDILRAAHAQYQARGGRLALSVVNGISPDALGELYAAADGFVLASRWEPWGVVLAEAAAAGLPIICTDQCGARHEVVRAGVNGLIVRSGSVEELAAAMARIGELDGSKGKALAAAYSCEAWSDRIVRIAEELSGGVEA